MSLEAKSSAAPRYLPDGVPWREATDDELAAKGISFDKDHVKIPVTGNVSTISVPRSDVIVLENGTLSLPSPAD